MADGTISLCGWEKFQHYKDRDPPWVKLYRDLLTSEAWVCGTDASRLVQVASILLAARYSNAIPMHQNVWNKVAGLDITADQARAAIRHLEQFGFLQVTENKGKSECASNALAERLQLAIPETETETETEGQIANAICLARVTKKRGSRLPPDWQPDEVAVRKAGLFDQVTELIPAQDREQWVDDVVASFCDYWHAATGRNSTKLDWQATFNTWMRKELGNVRQRGWNAARIAQARAGR